MSKHLTKEGNGYKISPEFFDIMSIIEKNSSFLGCLPFQRRGDETLPKQCKIPGEICPMKLDKKKYMKDYCFTRPTLFLIAPKIKYEETP